MKSITIQNVIIPLKQRACLCNNCESLFTEPYISINVYITNNCNASCQFCCNIDNKPFVFDIKKFYAFIDEAVSKIKIRKITFTGGEPSLDINNLVKCVKYVKGKCETITVCTNGTLLKHVDSKNTHHRNLFNSIDNISVSCHHSNHKINDSILGFKPGFEPAQLFPPLPLPIKRKINLSCNLIKGYIDSPATMQNLLEFADFFGIREVAFVSLLPVNDYCKNHYVDISSLENVPEILEYRKWEYPIPNICQCRNYLYRAKSNNLIKFYIRKNSCPTFNQGSYLVYKNNKAQNWY